MSILTDKMRAVPVAGAPSLLAAARATCLRGELVTLPKFGKAWIELAGERAVTEIEGAVFAEMEALKLPPIGINARSYESCRHRHTLARCVRSEANHEIPWGSVEEWGNVDSDLLIACAIVYADVRERLDPVGMDTLTQDDFDAIRIAIEKKNPILLRSYGVVALSIYVLTTASPLSTSPIPASSTGG